MKTANTEQVAAVLDEALDEAVGRSSKKWALVLVALVVGAAVAFWLTHRARSTESAVALVVDPLGEPTVAPAEVPAT